MSNKSVSVILAILLLFLTFRFNELLGFLCFLGVVLYFLLPYIFMIIGNKKYNEGSKEDSLIWYEKVYKLRQSSVKLKLTYTYVLIRLGQLDKAEQILEEFKKLDLTILDKASVTFNLSLVFWKSDRLPEAIKLLQDMYNDGFKSGLLYENLGFYYILSGDLEKALSFNLEAYTYSNTDITILDNLAYNYYCMNKYEEALEHYNMLISKSPPFASAYYYYGLTLEALERKEEALEILKKGLSCNFSYLSYVKKEQIEKEIQRLSH